MAMADSSSRTWKNNFPAHDGCAFDGRAINDTFTEALKIVSTSPGVSICNKTRVWNFSQTQPFAVSEGEKEKLFKLTVKI